MSNSIKMKSRSVGVSTMSMGTFIPPDNDSPRAKSREAAALVRVAKIHAKCHHCKKMTDGKSFYVGLENHKRWRFICETDQRICGL